MCVASLEDDMQVAWLEGGKMEREVLKYTLGGRRWPSRKSDVPAANQAIPRSGHAAVTPTPHPRGISLPVAPVVRHNAFPARPRNNPAPKCIGRDIFRELMGTTPPP